MLEVETKHFRPRDHKVVRKHLDLRENEVLVQISEVFTFDVRVSARPVLSRSLRLLLRVRAVKQVDLLALALAVVGLLMCH